MQSSDSGDVTDPDGGDDAASPVAQLVPLDVDG